MTQTSSPGHRPSHAGAPDCTQGSDGGGEQTHAPSVASGRQCSPSGQQWRSQSGKTASSQTDSSVVQKQPGPVSLATQTCSFEQAPLQAGAESPQTATRGGVQRQSPDASNEQTSPPAHSPSHAGADSSHGFAGETHSQPFGPGK
jgi:hypothetical protein